MLSGTFQEGLDRKFRGKSENPSGEHSDTILGSLAFGALLVAIIQLARLILEYIDVISHSRPNERNTLITNKYNICFVSQNAVFCVLKSSLNLLISMPTFRFR